MITIKLNNLQFHSYHGVHKEEHILGNTYEVNVEMTIGADEKITRLEQTINYEKAFFVIKDRMNTPTPLLETLAQELAEQLHAADRRIKLVHISIEKKFPPLATMQGSAGVIYKKEF